MNSNKIYIIAEMACSHEGDIRLAKKIIDGAGRSEADAIQLQIWDLKYMMSPQRSEYDFLKNIELSYDEWSELVDYTRYNFPKMDIYTFVYEHQSIDFIENLNIDGYKLSSSDLSNPFVLEKVASTGKPINLSVGASTLSEIQLALECVTKVSDSKITLMYGYQAFPTLPHTVHLEFIKKLNILFGLPIGYQDHCDADYEPAFWLPACAIGMGVDVIEKHITHDRSMKGIDHESALNPQEYIKFVEMIRILESAKGSDLPRSFSKEEIKYREFQKKSIVAARDLPAGTELTEKELAFMRAESIGLSPDKVEAIIGRFTRHDIPAYQALTKGDIA